VLVKRIWVLRDFDDNAAREITTAFRTRASWLACDLPEHVRQSELRRRLFKRNYPRADQRTLVGGRTLALATFERERKRR
jgi:hypothetical protein